MANQDAAFGLRPLKMSGQGDDSTGMSSHLIDARRKPSVVVRNGLLTISAINEFY